MSARACPFGASQTPQDGVCASPRDRVVILRPGLRPVVYVGAVRLARAAGIHRRCVEGPRFIARTRPAINVVAVGWFPLRAGGRRPGERNAISPPVARLPGQRKRAVRPSACHLDLPARDMAEPMPEKQCRVTSDERQKQQRSECALQLSASFPSRRLVDFRSFCHWTHSFGH